MISTLNPAPLKNYFHEQPVSPGTGAGNWQLQPHWQSFFSSFNKLGVGELVNRSHDMERFLKENGVTYNIYGDPNGLNRTWKLDIIPYMVSAQEWENCESGLLQRATLFDLILKDIYGPQQLLKEGILPMEVIYCHPGFLRQCCNVPLPGKHHLVVYAADIARAANGKIWILNDRTQAPSGAGYALENRLAMARIVPELFNGLKVRKLSPHFHHLRNALTSIAPHQKFEPRIVILTPGSDNETYFEHSFLSSHLGYTLVQGDDLMVKDNYVWLKTLGGLEKVDVIYRRLDDEYCDPLELKEDSQLGVPGLLQVVRSGNVSIANPLGSSVVENPGIIPFLPAISRYLLGEDLKLPTIASWWCGQPRELQFVLDNLAALVIKRVFRESGKPSSTDATVLSAAGLATLRAQILEAPHLYVGQEKVDFANTLSMVGDQLVGGNALFRNFVVSNNNGYSVMAGGLTRTSLSTNDIIISNQAGGFSKDTWILTDEESAAHGSKKEQEFLQQQNFVYGTGTLPSRTAENFYWVGRNAERVLGNARFQRTVMQFIDEANRAFHENDPSLQYCLMHALISYTYTYSDLELDEIDKKLEDTWTVLSELLLDENRQGSLSYNLNQFKRALFAVRDHWSSDTWRVLRDLEEGWSQAADLRKHGHYKLINEVDKLITGMMAFISLNRECISREQGWILLDCGRKIEATLLTIKLMQSLLVYGQDEQVEHILQEALLKSNESLVNYRYKYRAHLQLKLVLDLMMLDPSNPRSLIYHMERVQAYVSRLPKVTKGHILSEQQRYALEACTMLKLADPGYLAQFDEENGTYTHLDIFLKKMNTLVLGVADAIAKTYFQHVQKQQLYSSNNM